MTVSMNNVKSKARMKVHKLLDENMAVHGKWNMYSQIFKEMDKGRITLKEICVIAEGFGIPVGVIEMRRRDLIGMAGSLENLKNEEVA